MANNLQVFNHEQFGELQICTIDDKEYFGATNTATILGYANPHDAIGRHCKKDGVVKHEVIDSMGRIQEINLITEGNLYRLIVRSKLPKAVEFESWVFDIVLPTIRKAGGYVEDPETMVNTYFNTLDDDRRGIVLALFQNTKAQQQIIIEQKQEIDYKSDVISGLVDDISLADKRQILNRVVRKCSNFHDRWRELYENFQMLFHVNLNVRLESYNETHKPKMKNKLEYIEKVMGKINELFAIACKLYESDVNVLVAEMYGLYDVDEV